MNRLQKVIELKAGQMRAVGRAVARLAKVMGSSREIFYREQYVISKLMAFFMLKPLLMTCTKINFNSILSMDGDSFIECKRTQKWLSALRFCPAL